ncbi:unnamed protein product [Gemmataceae bacterium]|nr:unnamed protein product [Gemmataceae bacterium]VTT97998.1 unnamed protein product [Gemmataceae bacterium]
MSAGFKFADVVFWGTNGAVEALLEALVAQAESRFGTNDHLTTFLRDERTGFFSGKVVCLDELLGNPVARQRFLSLLDDAPRELIRAGTLTEYGSAWLGTEIAGLRDHIRRDGGITGRDSGEQP